MTKSGNITDRGGSRYVGKYQRDRTRGAPRNAPANDTRTTNPTSATRSCTPSSTTTPAWPTSRSSAAEKAVTAIGVLERAVAWFADRGVTVERVLSDNGSAYKSHAWRDACAALDVRHHAPFPTVRP